MYLTIYSPSYWEIIVEMFQLFSLKNNSPLFCYLLVWDRHRDTHFNLISNLTCTPPPKVRDQNPPFYSWRSWSSGSLHNFFKVIDVISRKVRSKFYISVSLQKVLFLNSASFWIGIGFPFNPKSRDWLRQVRGYYPPFPHRKEKKN